MNREEARQIIETWLVWLVSSKGAEVQRGYIEGQFNEEDVEAFRMAIEALEQSQWVPCSESMPEEHEWLGTKHFGTTKSDEVYVTFENPKGERFCRHLSFQNGKLSTSDQSTIDAWFKGSRPIAWMTMPDPWKGEEKGVSK